jgi:hypothetical protein
LANGARIDDGALVVLNPSLDDNLVASAIKAVEGDNRPPALNTTARLAHPPAKSGGIQWTAISWWSGRPRAVGLGHSPKAPARLLI